MSQGHGHDPLAIYDWCEDCIKEHNLQPSTLIQDIIKSVTNKGFNDLILEIEQPEFADIDQLVLEEETRG